MRQHGSVLSERLIELGMDGTVHVDIRMDPLKDFGHPWLFNHRVDLHNALLKLATGEGPGISAKLRTGAEVVDCNCDTGELTLKSGEIVKADVVIAADGIKSSLRNHVLGEKQSAKPSGHSAYRCLIDAEHIKNDKDLSFITEGGGIYIWVGPDRRIVAYPCRNLTQVNIVAMIPDEFLHEESKESWNAAGNVGDMLSSFNTFCPAAQRLLSHVTECGLWQLREQDPLPTWTKGKVILIGDAAHPMLPHQGQGAGQAIEDAEALAVVLDNISDPSAVPSSLHLVQQIRYERASTIQGYSRMQAFGPRNGDKDKVRLNANQFAFYNWSYKGAQSVLDKMQTETIVHPAPAAKETLA